MLPALGKHIYPLTFNFSVSNPGAVMTQPLQTWQTFMLMRGAQYSGEVEDQWVTLRNPRAVVVLSIASRDIGVFT